MSMSEVSPLTRRRHLLASAAGWALGAPWGRSATAVTASPLQLEVAAFPAVDEVIRAAIPAFEAAYPGVKVRLISRQYADHHTAMTTALSTSVKVPDVMALEASYVGRFSQGGGLMDLRPSPFDVQALQPRFVPYAYDTAVSRNGAVVAVPTDIGPGTLMYRADLTERAGVTLTDLTRSWDSWVEAGIRIKARTGAYLIGAAQSVKDILCRIGRGPGEGIYFDTASRVLVESARFRRAFALARRVRREGLDAQVATWTNDWAEGFKRGLQATELNGAWMVGQMAHWIAPATAGLWRVAQLPEDSYVSYGGTFYALPRQCPEAHRSAAWALVEMLTLDRDRQLAALKNEDAFPALLEAQDAPFFDEPMPFLGGQRARRLWRDAARRIQATPVHKQDRFADEVINTELSLVLDQNKDIDQALADARRLLERRAFR